MDSVTYMKKNGSTFFAGCYFDDGFNPYAHEGMIGITPPLHSDSDTTCRSNSKVTIFVTSGDEVSYNPEKDNRAYK